MDILHAGSHDSTIAKWSKSEYFVVTEKEYFIHPKWHLNDSYQIRLVFDYTVTD